MLMPEKSTMSTSHSWVSRSGSATNTTAGVFASFTPFIGFHFLLAFALAYLVAGNMAAAALGTALAGLVEQDAPPAPDISVKGSMKVGGPINVIGSGFEPGAEYVVELRSPSQVLGTTTVKPNGCA